MFWQAFEIVHLYQVERNWSLRTENLNVARLLTRWGLEALGFEERWCRNQEEGCCKVAEALIRQCRGLGKYICLYSVSVNRLTIHHNKQPLNLNFFLKNDWPIMLTDKTFRERKHLRLIRVKLLSSGGERMTWVWGARHVALTDRKSREHVLGRKLSVEVEPRPVSQVSVTVLTLLSCHLSEVGNNEN